ncbi:MAG: hypothetical protein KME20_17915 [Kaiparowitsia implicata GSE-PSE-MK54-09C]|jgi:hypothetical protein|nr:hypothetical protein [Kaiparowitsia implicata GSE-PSE-MK54-09C]
MSILVAVPGAVGHDRAALHSLTENTDRKKYGGMLSLRKGMQAGLPHDSALECRDLEVNQTIKIKKIKGAIALKMPHLGQT